MSDFVTADEIATRLKLSKTASYALMRRLGAAKDGKRLLLDVHEFETFLRSGGDPRPIAAKPEPLERTMRRTLIDHMGEVPCTYVIAADSVGLAKIGRSKKFAKRLENLVAGSPVTLRLIARFRDYHLEERLHERFAKWRRHAEWFELAPVVALIDTVRR
jgi:hypothetical protein